MSPSGQATEEPPRTPRRGIRILGVPIRLHFTFVLLVIFIVTLGARGGESAVFNAIYILALFASVVLHELGHVGVSKRYGIRTLEIVLYPIGGVARMERSPKPNEELWITLAGPAVNVLIAAALFAYLGYMRAEVHLTSLMEPSDANLLARIAIGNLILAAFNLVPAFPMDGGRVLRALLARKQSEEQATRTAAAAGRLFAILIGLYGLVSMQFMLIFIAFFVYLGASQETAAVLGKSLTEGVPVRRAMITDFRTLEHGTTVREAANMLLATSQQDFPIVLGEQVMGLLGRNALLRGMAVDGPDAYVAGIMDRNFPRVAPDDSLAQAIPLLGQTSCVLVMDQDRLLGLLTRENLSEFMMLRRFGIMADTRLKRMHDVIIVGAGAAGLSAASDLVAAGRSVLIIEARDRVGGRMHSLRPPGLAIAIELGAEFIHGQPAEIAWTNKRKVQGRRWYVDNDILHPLDANREVEEILERLDNYTGCDISFAEYLRRYEGNTAVESRAWATEYIEGFNAADAERIGVHSLIQETRASENDDAQELFCLNDGYSAFAASLLPQDADLLLTTTVEEIRWSRGSVEIAGRKARAAVVTLPLGVLQTRKVRFAPEIPQKIAAAAHLAVGPVVRVTFQFRERFWERLAPGLCMLHTHDSQFPTWWSVRPDESPVLTGWAAARRALRLSRNSTDENKAIALESLSRLLRIDAAQYLVEAYTHDWTNDPYSCGAYSYIPAGAIDAPAMLAATVEDTLYFAGEATETTGRGASVHGAIATGRRAAAEILNS